jgi:transcriptional regulator with XRE-family HTH domain
VTPQEWREIFASNLVDILEEKGMTQNELAEDARIPKSRISEYIHARATPTIFALIDMAYALDMDLDEFADFGDRVY